MSAKTKTGKAKKDDDLIEVEVEESNTFEFANLGGNNEDEVPVTKPGVLARERR